VTGDAHGARHVGVVFDIGHEFGRLRGHRILPRTARRGRGSSSSNCRKPPPCGYPRSPRTTWRPLRDSRTPSTSARRPDAGRGDHRYLNLGDAWPPAMPTPAGHASGGHFHVPVFLDEIGGFRTTRTVIQDALRLIAAPGHTESEAGSADRRRAPVRSQTDGGSPLIGRGTGFDGRPRADVHGLWVARLQPAASSSGRGAVQPCSVRLLTSPLTGASMFSIVKSQ
jgi:hypothetical protein